VFNRLQVAKDKCSWFTSERSHFYNNSPRTNCPMVILTRLDRVSLVASELPYLGTTV